jgi:ferrochelatase
MQVILLVNLGSPNDLSVTSIRKFLRKFLADQRVVSLPRILWYPILYGIILPLRAKKLLKQYKHIWLNNYSPLIYYTLQQHSKLQLKLEADIGTLVVHAFSYANPDIHDVLTKLHARNNIDKLVVLPLYPQFSSTTTSAVFDQVAAFYAKQKYLPNLSFISDFHNSASYLDAIAKSILQHINQYGKPECLVFSYHSLPVRIIEGGDKYYEQCLAGAQLIAAALGLGEDEYRITFQSKFGGGKWIAPATANVMAELAKSGVKHIAVVCPGFISDCLETLEEIAITNSEIFMNNGGEKYYYIPCLNDSESCIDLLYQLVKE